MPRKRPCCLVASLTLLVAGSLLVSGPRTALADGKVIPPQDYTGSLEESAQEAIIIFQRSETMGEATEDLILKIRVEGDAERFAWVVPLPNEPTYDKEDPRLFQELFDYVQSRKYRPGKGGFKDAAAGSAQGEDAAESPVKVISRRTVGEFEIAVVREQQGGALNPWLKENGYQELQNAEDVLGFYRKKGYVYACIKVNSQALASQREIESHPLRFTFKTGGRDGIYFPMKLTGLQSQPFDVNLYVFFRYWINDKVSRFGYMHRGFELVYRDWDSPECEPDGGKTYSLPEADPFLSSYAHKIPTVTKLMQKLHPGEKYYLTNIQAASLDPVHVRGWSDDLWLFPYYTNPNVVPHDVRDGGPAADGYAAGVYSDAASSSAGSRSADRTKSNIVLAGAVAGGVVLAVLVWLLFRHWRRLAERRRFERLDGSETGKS